MVSSLLAALMDPASHTREALQQLLDTSFVNSVDAPSLALIIPILKRGLHDRSPSIKRTVSGFCSLLHSYFDVFRLH